MEQIGNLRGKVRQGILNILGLLIGQGLNWKKASNDQFAQKRLSSFAFPQHKRLGAAERRRIAQHLILRIHHLGAKLRA
jgi:hypothetical protein